MTNLKEYGIVELLDGLTLEIIKEKHSWLLSAQVSLAVIGLDGETIVWKSGIWKSGIWKSGIWKGGIWKGGVWESGRWLDGVWKGGYRFSEKSPK